MSTADQLGILFFTCCAIVAAVIVYMVYNRINLEKKKKAAIQAKQAAANNQIASKKEVLNERKVNLQIALLANILAEIRNKKPDVYNTTVTNNVQNNYQVNERQQ
jgi:hypothetical protein